MAPGHLLFSLRIPTLTVLYLLLSKHGNFCFTCIFCFGDSISDTGNYLKFIGNSYHPIHNLPYGETYFGRATGRYSDGRLILDFVAEAYGLPFVPPYLSGMSTKELLHGANFAVGGTMALNNSFFESKGFEMSRSDYSLGTQLQWFKKLLPSIFIEPGLNCPLMACCGAKGPYNYSSIVSCGNQGSTVCSDSSKYASWDGLHWTEAAYKMIEHGVLRGSYSSPPMSDACSDIMHDSGSLHLNPSNTM